MAARADLVLAGGHLDPRLLQLGLGSFLGSSRAALAALLV